MMLMMMMHPLSLSPTLATSYKPPGEESGKTPLKTGGNRGGDDVIRLGRTIRPRPGVSVCEASAKAVSSPGQQSHAKRIPRTMASFRVLLLMLPLLGGSTLFGVTQCDALDAYYPTSRLHLSIPTSKESYIILRNHPLLNLVPSIEQIPRPAYRYTIESPVEEASYLKIDSGSGDVWIASHFLDFRTPTEFIISASPVNESGATLLRLSLTIEPIHVAEDGLANFCRNHFERICFWESATYRIRENEPSGFVIGPIGPRFYRELCRTKAVSYSLENGTDYLTERNGSFLNRVPLDHDSLRPGPTLLVGVSCTVQFDEAETGSVALYQAEKTVKVDVLDQNDNGPRLEHMNDTRIELELDDPHIYRDQPLSHLKVLFVDNDTIAMNNHVHYQLLNDTYKLFAPKCTSFEIERTAGIKQTVFSCELIAQQTGILPNEMYCVILKAVDETLPPNSTAGNRLRKSLICIHPNHDRLLLPRPEALISADNPAATVSVQSSPAQTENGKPGRSRGGEGRKRSNNKASLANLHYPQAVNLFNTSTRFARVAVPNNFYDQIRDSKVDLDFRLLRNPLNAFDITKVGGIIYLKNTTNIQKHLSDVVLSLVVGWMNRNATIRITLKANTQWPGNLCNASTENFCSIHPNQTSCVSSCGIGSVDGSCKFRLSDAMLNLGGPLQASRDQESPFEHSYPTCTPDLNYCPDNFCDPLEQMAYQEKIQICPQDCVPWNEIIGVHHIDKSKPIGIHMSATICTCRATGQCDCNDGVGVRNEDRRVKTKSTTQSSSTTTTEIPTTASKGNSTGGASSPEAVRDGFGGFHHATGLIKGPNAPIYLLAIVVIPMVIAILLVVICFSRRIGLKKKIDKNSIPLQNVSNETEVFNVELPLNSRINDINFKIDFDSKWEFPRSNLILDVTLGEGEFGKVLKGYATDLPEKPGITTVAVKMLKTGANSVELLALLSEYQLLQEVAHPNVIRLLGACTKGESPLLIIEYCQYGSLKNYLRLSRKLEVMNSADYENAIAPITVKDILSFSWQISKGMAYLTEIKLVHRDLAARNVLLAEGKVCKISDFGLTRDVYEDDAYLKKSKDRVPVKWMAPESLADHIYTTKSDVWAFGVLCWELITLGASPYPGILPQDLYTLLKQGYRMPCPTNCSEEIYSIVRSCWADDPKLRPSFKYLAGQFEALLGRSAKYVDMEQNSISNPVYCENAAADETDCAKISFVKEEQDRLESLWIPPQYEPSSASTADSSFRYLSPLLMDKKTLMLQSYDIPRPLIETGTIEQKLRYENDVRLRPRKINNDGTYPPSSTPTTVYMNSSQPNLMCRLMEEETSFIVPNMEYDSPSRQPRRVSYLDMNKNTVNLNLEINNMVDKKQSKELAFRFSSVENDLQTSKSEYQYQTQPSSCTAISIELDKNESDMDHGLQNHDSGIAMTSGDLGSIGRDEVDYPCKKQHDFIQESQAITVTSTV
ncbi:uncharacterized protein LOC129747397 [Uranotaenia lowii]|uniref:uncharacterized protein LOC129747397 n=1 Tax=Uranotaenia lowii TaxID=190385 RepID=UPI0024789813|nr:uncharacterized protein LOC129747397 [Uranotaenia lowii]XP_055597574.1 uncharacterized protein LOC129747397 [Uranotaenia lowii]XP_055597575.1 uncharacterized protein LOC129747397 [Uranotaenia lowii]XP_055597576.1 uncharacterized protein LOC129747397 [Uranotaenia lowii]